jgi:TRAP-type C4-dicarboxylate transport system permease small subunit
MIGRFYDGLIVGLAGLAGAILVFVLIAIIYDITARNLGFQPLELTSALSEYSMLLVPCLSAPWLVRNGAHIIVDSFTRLLPLGPRRIVEMGSCLVCIAICLVLCWYSAVLTIEYARLGVLDIRSVALPKWILTAALFLAFLLMPLEFALHLRRLVTGEQKTPRTGASL